MHCQYGNMLPIMTDLSPAGNLFSELVLEVFRVHRVLVEAGDKMTQPVQLSTARWQVLGVVEHGPISAANAARLMGLTRQGVQRTADSLEADGLITYRPNPHHRRAKLLTLTPKGRDAIDYVKECQAEWANRLSESHSLETLQSALVVLRQMRDSLDPDGLQTSEEYKL